MVGERHGGMPGLQKRGVPRSRRAVAREGTTMILNGPGISYTEPDIGAEFVPPLPEHPREAIVKLCEHCTNRLLHRDELLGYEYWSFAEAATDEQAEVLCKMKMRRPYTLPEMVKLTGMPEADIEKMLDDMSYTGLLEYNWENLERAKQWVLPMLVPGSAEFLNMRVSQLEEHPVYAKFFEQASKGPLSKATPMVPPGGAGIGMHVIPVEKAIDAASTSVPIEHIEHWLDLGGEDVIALGGDWDGATVPAFLSDASKMPEFQNMLSKHFGKTVMQKLCSDNALAFFERY